jgi:hypothetical protein
MIQVTSEVIDIKAPAADVFTHFARFSLINSGGIATSLFSTVV